MNRVMDLALESPEIADKVRRDDALKVFHVSIVFLILEVLALAVMGLIITHRVCGPIFVIHRHLVTLRDGKYPSTRPLRQGDEFKETFKLFAEVLDLLKQRDRDEAVTLKELIAVMHEKGQPEELIAPIRQLVAEREARAIENTNS